MGDLKGLAKSKMMELEELYLGIPDDSVNLTFQDLANVKQSANSSPEKKKSTPNMKTIQEGKSSLNKLPSLDFNRALQESKNNHHHSKYHLHDHVGNENHHHLNHHQQNHYHHHHHHRYHDAEGMHMSDGHHGYDFGGHREFRHEMENNRAYDDMSVMSMGMNSMYQERGGRPRRPGIPHSNICTICSTYIYIFRRRCLVCGRVYCRNCVSTGMGEMTEGRKCIECLGRLFSQRYIQRAAKVECCSRYPSNVKQAELRWAEKGPRRTGERANGNSIMVSRSRSPVNPMTPSRAHVHNSPPSFVSTSSPYSPYSPNHHHLPL